MLGTLEFSRLLRSRLKAARNDGRGRLLRCARNDGRRGFWVDSKIVDGGKSAGGFLW